MSNQIIGTYGFVVWVYSIIYMGFVRAFRNIYVRIVTHLIGLLLTILGAYALITTMPSMISILSLILILLGIVIFITPFGINAEL